MTRATLADWIEAWKAVLGSGMILVLDTSEDVVKHKVSHTGKYLKSALR